MQLTHTGNNCLAGFRVRRNVEGWIFLCQAIQRNAKLVLILSRLWFDRDANHRGRKLHFLEDNRLGLVANRVAGGDLPHAANRNDLARAGVFNILALVGVHSHQPAYTFLAAFARIVGV